MDNIFLLSSAQTLAFAVVGALALWLLLRGFDKLNKKPFSETLGDMQHEPKALALYYGMRFVGVCIFFGMVLS